MDLRTERRAFGRWVGWRNASSFLDSCSFAGAGEVWQFAISKDKLTFDNALQSPVLDQLQQAAQGNKGIVVQFCFYQVIPTIATKDLLGNYSISTKGIENPAQGLMVGTIGVWEEGELMTTPSDRLLLRPSTLPPETAVNTACQFMGPATARVQRDVKVVSLNLITAFPEAGFKPPYDKADLGDIYLAYIPDSGGGPILLGDPIEYDRVEYDLTAGIVDVEYQDLSLLPQDLQGGGLLLLAWPDRTLNVVYPILTEEDSTIRIETDDRGIYSDVRQDGKLSILVRERGGPPQKPVDIYLWEYQYVPCSVTTSQSHAPTLTLVEDGPPLQHRLDYSRKVTFPAGSRDPYEIRFHTLRPGAVALVFTRDGQPLSGDYPWGTASYAGVRVLPDDDFSSVDKQLRISWDYIYNVIFRYYHLVFPAMSGVIALNDRTEMEQAADLLVDYTEPDRRYGTTYMPPSRDLSTGKRALIVEWANSVPPSHKRKAPSIRLRGAAPPTPPPPPAPPRTP